MVPSFLRLEFGTYFSSALCVLSVALILPFLVQKNPSKSEILCNILQRRTVSPRLTLKSDSDQYNAIIICTNEIVHINGLLYRKHMKPQFLLSLWHESELFKQNRHNRPLQIPSFNVLTHYNYDTCILLFISVCSKV